MLARPRFKPQFQVRTVTGEGVFLLCGLEQKVLQGSAFEKVAPYLDGRSVEELCAQLRGELSPAKVHYALGQLQKRGYLSDADETFSSGQAALWSHQQIDEKTAARKLAENSVSLHILCDAGDPVALQTLLSSLKVRVSNDAGNLRVVMTDSYLRPELDAINERALRENHSWLLAKPVGRQIWLGPLFRPGKTACWRCLSDRLRANVPVASYLEDKLGRTGLTITDPCFTEATLQVAHGLIATAISSWAVTGEIPHLEGIVQSVEVVNGQSRAHALLRQPYCPACRPLGPSPLEIVPEPITLKSGAKKHLQDLGHRTASPQETLDRYLHHVSPITGAVSILEPVSIAGEGVFHVYVSGQNVARPRQGLAEVTRDLRFMDGGKGRTAIQARVSALCESLERYSGIWRGNEPVRRGSLISLGDSAIHPNDCMLFSEKQYREREQWNASRSSFGYVSEPFQPETEREWSPVWSLTLGKLRYLPTEYCYYDYAPKDLRLQSVACSNGNASGNTLEEAILQGFLELIERDSVALWWYNRLNRPRVDLESFEDPYFTKLRDLFAKHGRDLWVLDLTSDLGIPVFTAISKRIDRPQEQIMLGFGAHVDAKVALNRAVTELNQMLGIFRGLNGDSSSDFITDADTLHWLQTATIENQTYLLPSEIVRAAHDFPPCTTSDFREDILKLQSIVEQKGMELLVLDQTRSEIAMPVAKVIVPGLRHFWARFAPGRLYDVPVQMGWLSEARREDELNPIPLFL